MSQHSLIRSIGLLFCLIVFSFELSAEDREGAFSITPQVGGYLFEGDQNLEHGFTLGLGAGYNFTQNWGAEFLFNYLNTEFKSAPVDVNGYLYRFDVLYHFMPEKKTVPYVAAGLGGITLDPDVGRKDTSFIMNYGGGLKYFFTDRVALRGDVRHVISFDDTHHNMIYTLGVDFLFGGKKKAAPPVIAPETPAPEPDSDGDGVADRRDACPDTPRGVKVNSSGCPLDTDGDGVYDYLDKCPDTPKGVKVNSSGCPPDTDGDGVYDYLDKCPDTPKGVKVNSSGCPLDTDGDGVYDYLDKCPGTARDLKVDADGCPILMKKKISVTLDIQFDTDKADIKPEYNDRLKEVADFMATYPDTTAVIEGHTDSVGSAAYNLKLSKRRADSVRDYLIKNFNISPNRLAAEGFGEEQPAASNDTAEGRRINRRIQAVFNAEAEYYEKR